MTTKVSDVLDATAAKYPDRPAMKAKRNGQWHATSWREYREQARRVARGFIKLGLQRGDGVSIIGFNRPEWFLADIGAILAGGVPAGIYTTSTAEQCHYITEHCEAPSPWSRTPSSSRSSAVRAAAAEAEGVGADDRQRFHARAWSRGSSCSRSATSVPEAELEARIAAQKPDDVCTLIYTSGTTGEPKAVMITHDNIRSTAESFCTMIEPGPDDAVISYLPLSPHRRADPHDPRPDGDRLCSYFAESIEKLGDNLREVRPDALPRRAARLGEDPGEDGGGRRDEPAAHARRSSPGRAGWVWRRATPSSRAARRPLLYPLAKKLVFAKVRERLGLDRCRAAFTTAAPIAKSTLEFFLASASRSRGLRDERVHRAGDLLAAGPLPHRQVRASACPAPSSRSPRTARSACAAATSSRATSRIPRRPPKRSTPRAGSTPATSARSTPTASCRSPTARRTCSSPPAARTSRRRCSRGSSRASRWSARRWSSAIDASTWRRWSRSIRRSSRPARPRPAARAGSWRRRRRASKFRAWLQHRIDEVNQKLARVQTIKRFAIIPGEFTIDGGELTPTMKVKRKAISAKYEAAIERMYAD